MIKITSGRLKNRSIDRVGIKSTRETASMVREAVFNILYDINDFTVLDLFAGSGSYGITAFSNGASKIYFVDKNKDAIQTIIKNIKKTQIDESCVVINKSYDDFLNKNEIKFDLIFLDPPYNFEDYSKLLEETSRYLTKNGQIVLEIDRKTNFNFEINNLELTKNKIYGTKKILIYLNNL